MAHDLKCTARLDERRARILKQKVRYDVALRGVKRLVLGGASRSEPFDYFDHAREEARMAELLGGESRKRADEARDFLRKAREVVNGARGAPQRLGETRNGSTRRRMRINSLAAASRKRLKTSGTP